MRIIVVLYKDYLIFELYLPKKKKLMFLFDDNKQLLYSEYHKLKFYLSIIIYPNDLLFPWRKVESWNPFNLYTSGNDNWDYLERAGIHL